MNIISVMVQGNHEKNKKLAKDETMKLVTMYFNSDALGLIGRRLI